MNEWLLFAIILGVSLPLGLGIGLYIRLRHPSSARQYAEVSMHTRWPFYAVCAVFFLTMGIIIEMLPLRILFLVCAVVQFAVGVYAFIRDRTQFSMKHLFLATTLAAMLAALFSWFGMRMIYVLLVASWSGIGLLTLLE